MAEKVAVVIRVLEGKKVKHHSIHNNLSPQGAKLFAEEVKKLYPKAEIYFVDYHNPMAPPEDYDPARSNPNRYWCSFCGSYRRFIHDARLDVNRCEICRISDREFYIRKANGLFKRKSPKALTPEQEKRRDRRLRRKRLQQRKGR